MAVADAAMALCPRPHPTIERLDACRIISHRGEHRQVTENTLAAFDLARSAGVWGIELDLQWTGDGEPVVFHDPDLFRLYGVDRHIGGFRHQALRRQFPAIPALAEVVERYGGDLHLMIEIKKETYPDPAHQKRVLEKLLSPLAPRKDYHLLSLCPQMFDHFDFVPTGTFLPVAEINVRRLSRLALRKNWRGLSGHFLIMGHRIVQKHLQGGQSVGTGFVNSPNCMFRELNRGVTWLFSNQATALQAALDRLIK